MPEPQVRLRVCVVVDDEEIQLPAEISGMPVHGIARQTHERHEHDNWRYALVVEDVDADKEDPEAECFILYLWMPETGELEKVKAASNYEDAQNLLSSALAGTTAYIHLPSPEEK